MNIKGAIKDIFEGIFEIKEGLRDIKEGLIDILEYEFCECKRDITEGKSKGHLKVYIDEIAYFIR